MPLSVGSRAKRDCGTATWGLGRLIFPNDSPLWYNIGRRKTPLTERQHKYSHWCLHQVSNLQKQAYSRFFTPTWSLVFAFLLCMCAWMNECMCLCTFSLCAPVVWSLCPGTEAPGGRLIYSCGPREDCTSSSSFGMVLYPEHRPAETQVHGGARHPADTVPRSPTGGHSQITLLYISCIFIKKTRQNFSEHFCLAKHARLLRRCLSFFCQDWN